MLYAFIAYKNHFSNAITALVDQLNAYRMLGLHLERIADIAQTPGETGLVTQSAFLAPVSGALEMVGVSYRYGEGEPEVVSELSMSVGQGEVVCLRGPTGCGKSTVLKIAMGLIEPTSGSVVVGEQDLKGLGARRFRAAIASVASEDTLLQGSVFDNVSLFELEPVGERVEWACRQAEIHQEISLMPMGYQTQIGPAGGGLSAGQRQRLLLARALYRQPTYLFLDEATANLDTNTERRVMENLRSLELSCLVATHSDAVASYAHRQLDFGTRLALNATDRMNG